MIDPARLNNLVPEAAPVRLDDLAALNVVFLTHSHSDHVDVALLRELAKLSHLHWVVPSDTACPFRASSCLSPCSR